MGLIKREDVTYDMLRKLFKENTPEEVVVNTAVEDLNLMFMTVFNDDDLTGVGDLEKAQLLNAFISSNPESKSEGELVQLTKGILERHGFTKHASQAVPPKK